MGATENKNETISKLENIKSKYILKQIIDNMPKHIYLNIIKYNKKLQDILNTNINDYKKCSEIFSSIHIEIKLVEGKYGKFINILDEDEAYYHKYFDKNKEEIKRNNTCENDKVSKIKIKIDYHELSLCELFKDCNNIESIYFKKFYRNNINDMSYMFSGCSSLKELNISNFNTSNVTDMQYMFDRCSSLKQLDLSNFNTGNVTNMNNMFRECRSLTKNNVSNFNTKNVTHMNGMFSLCTSLKELDLSNFKTEKVILMSGMFFGCSSLTKVNLTNFNTRNVTVLNGMFYQCSSLKKLILPNISTEGPKSMNAMFYGCSEELINHVKSKYKNIYDFAFNPQ